MGSRSASGSWEGHAELQQALEGLACAKGTSANRVKAVATTALRYAKDYKRVVYEVETFLWKADVEHRLAGLYAMDAIMRQSCIKNGPKDQFVKRFSLHLSHTIAAVKKIPMDSQQNAGHVIKEWHTRGYYSLQLIEESGGQRYLQGGLDQEPDVQSPNSRDTTPTASAGKLASLLSIIKKRKEQAPEDRRAASSSPPRGRSPPRYERDARDSGYDRRSDRDNRREEERPSRQDRDSREDRRREDDRYERQPPPSRGLLGSAPGSPSDRSQRVRRDPPSDRYENWDEPRDVKKARGSRWGPPKPAEDTSRARPAPINTARHEPSYPMPPRYPDQAESRSPPRRAADSSRMTSSSPPRSSWDRGFESRGDSRGPQVNGAPMMSQGYQQQPSPQGQSQGSGDKIPGTSGELCRKFVSGRCTFGDRCWHVHDPETNGSRPRVEINDAKRKTVLCANFPAGKCRFGDKCSFAHGEHELSSNKPSPHGSSSHDSSSMHDRASPMNGGGGRWPQASPHGRPDPSSFPPRNGVPNSGNAYGPPPPQQQSRPFEAGMRPPHGVYNEPPLGDRGAPSVSYPNAPAPGVTYANQAFAPTTRAPPISQPSPMAGHAPGSSMQAPGAPSSGFFGGGSRPQAPRGFADSAPDGYTPQIHHQPAAADDDEGESAAPEFTLEYDDED